MPSNDIIKLLKLEDVIYKNFEETEKEIIFYLERKDKRPICIKCGNSNLHINEWRVHKITDIPFHLKKIKLHIKKQRYYCPCCHKKITSSISMVEPQKQHTRRIIEYIRERLKNNVNFKDCSKEISLSISSVMRIFNENTNFKSPLEAPKVLHIDEFKGNSNKEKYQLGLFNGENKRVFDILENRKSKTLKEYLSVLKNKPEVVVIDMWEPYYNVVKSLWKDVIVVADKFHYVRQISWALRDVRIRVQEKNKNGKRIKKYWKLFAKNSNELTEKQRFRLEELLNYSDELKEAYCYKEMFDKTVLRSTKEKAHENFDAWLDCLQESNLSEIIKLRNTFENWYCEVVSSFYYEFTNGVAEGINNKIKVIKRQSYGIKKFSNFRNLIMLRIS